ncbi:MAG: hypothetical protein JWO36_5361 [Myxococcales bacterium]|nr:hypothetical protein [Myxococcales bacterium]
MMRAILLVALAATACVDHNGPITGTQSLKVELTLPADPGSITNRLADGARAVSFTITAYDADGKIDTTFTNPLQAYVSYLGTLTPYFGGTPFAVVNMVAGKGTVSATLPPVFGPTTVWFDDSADATATYATGVSPTLWYRDPYISDIQTPASEAALNALTNSPLENKNVSVQITRYGARGRLVITSRFAQGYTLADVQCADNNGSPPCTSQAYDSIDVFSYSAPQDQNKRFLNEGQIVDGFAGGITNFDGLIEVGFPQTFVTGLPAICLACEPVPVKVDASNAAATDWFLNPINFKRHQSAAIELDNAKVCDLDSDYMTFKQWKVDPAGIGGNCKSNKRVLNVISNASLDLDPATIVGKTLPRIVGVLRPIMLPGFNVWIIYPRSMADITVP